MIIHHVDSGFTVGDGGDLSALWNIDGDGNAELEIRATASTSYGSTYAAIHLTYFATGVGIFKGHGRLTNLTPGVVVNRTASFFEDNLESVVSNGNIKGVGFTSGTPGYIGFKFDSADLEPITLYGWAQVVLTNGDTYGTFEVVQWAYEDSGAGIMVGATSAVPEPETVAGGLGLLALGAAGLRRWRKQKQAA